MKPQAPEAFAAFVGLDWADAKHDICIQAAGSARREFLHLEHRPEAIDAWVQSLHTRFNGHPIAVCLELNKGPIVSALCKYACLVLFPVNPLTVAKYREAFTPSQAKNDPLMPNSRSNCSSNTATSSQHSPPKAPPCAPWRNSSNTAVVWSATKSG